MDFAEPSGASKDRHPWWDELRYPNQAGSSPVSTPQQQLQCNAVRSTVVSSAATTPGPRLPARMSPSPCQLQPQHRHHQRSQQQQQQQQQQLHQRPADEFQPQHQQQHRYTRDRSATSSRVVSPGSLSAATATAGGATAAAAAAAASAATSSEADWLNQQLSDIQQLKRQQLISGLQGRDCSVEQEEINVNNDALDETVDDNASHARSVRRQSSTAADSPYRHRRHHRRRHHRRHWRRRPPSFSSYTSSESCDSGSSPTDSSSSNSSATCRSVPPAAQVAPASSKSNAGAPKQGADQNSAGDSIEAVYTNFLSISQRLSALISEYYSTAAAVTAPQLEFNQQQQPVPPTRQLSLVSSRSSAIYNGDSADEKSPNQALILPSPLRRSMSNKRREQLAQRQQQDQLDQQQQQQQPRVHLPPPRPLPPLPQQQQQQQSQSRTGKDRKVKSKSRHHYHSKSKSQQQSETGGSSSNSKGGLGFGSRIRASLTKKFSPRQSRQEQQQDEAPSGQQQKQQQQQQPEQQPEQQQQQQKERQKMQQKQQQQQPQPQNFNSMLPAPSTADYVGKLAEDSQQAAHSSVGRHQTADEAVNESAALAAAAAAVTAADFVPAGRVNLDSRVPLIGDRQSADACLAKLQRLRATVVDLVQRSIDPVLKSLRSIQSGGVGTRTALAGVAVEVSATLSDVMSLMELLSRSVMLVSMHNLDPNSLKLVYLSSSYIRSLKRLAKGLNAPDSAAAGADEAAGDADDADRDSRLEL